MSSMWRLAGFPSLAVALVLAAGCGGDDSSANFDPPPGSGGEGGSGSGSGGRRGGGGAGTGGRAPGNGGTAPGTGGDTVDGGTGGEASSGGTDGGASGGAANAGGAANPDGGTGGAQDAGGAQNAGGSTAGGAQNAGGSSAGGTSSGGAGTGGAPNRPNGGTCQNAGQCASGNCVGTICCALPCNAPAVCETQSALCINNGTTCQYSKATDRTPCEDGDLCTESGTECFDGRCVAGDNVVAKDCDDNNACTNDTCNPANGACQHPALNCNDNNPCTNDSCNATTGCRNANNVLVCNDGNACTTNDRCGSGQCSGTPRDCSASTTDCSLGVCNAAGACVAQPRNNGQACDHDLNTCSATGLCNAAGVCIDQNNACGPLATGCVACTSGAQCFAGRDCTCTGAGILEQNGQCVRSTDQCAANPCSPNATCLDPTPSTATAETADQLCTCRPGFTGNGVTCTCGAGRQIIDTPSGPECVCDLDGSYVLTTTAYISWPEVLGTIEASRTAGEPSYSWALRHHTTLPDGSLQVQTIPCGGTSPTLCNKQQDVQRAYALYTPTQSLGKPGMVCPIPSMCVNGVPTFSVPLSGVRPGGSYVEPEVANLLGISLTDPAGAWPASPTSTTNGATPVDSDGDGAAGVRQLLVLTGGETIDGLNDDDPPFNYGATSVCPRLDTNAPRWGYRAIPGYVFIFEFATYEWAGASRIRGNLSSTNGTAGNAITMQANSCVITGDLMGQDDGKPQADAVMWGCQTCAAASSDTCNPGGACNANEVGFYNGAPQTEQTIQSSTFRLASTTIDMAAILATTNPTTRENLIVQACAEVRAANCPVGETCVAP